MSGIPILTYHSIDSSGSVISVSRKMFADHLRILRENSFQVISLGEAVQLLHDGVQSERKVVLTFDDGFENFYTDAFPLLSEFKFPATVFLVTDFLARENNWPGQSPVVPRLPLLNRTQILELSKAGVEFGAHSCTHPDLTRIARDRAQREIVDSQDAIQQEIGRSVSWFAYPYGYSNKTVRDLVRENFQAGLGTRLSKTTARDDFCDLSRIDVYYLLRCFGLTGSHWLDLYLKLRNLARQLRRTVGTR